MRPAKGEGTFVVHCSSAAYQSYFQEFLNKQLGLEKYGLLAVPGGVQSLTLEEHLPKFAWAAWRHIKFLVDLDAPARVVLIGHDDCRWYHRGPIAHFVGPERARQEADLRKVAASWRERFPGAAIEAYYGVVDKGRGVFQSVR